MRSNSKHTAQELERYIRLYLEEGTPIRQSARKYNIPSADPVRNWIIKYTKGGNIRSYSPKPEVYTMKGRKTTQEEKIQIVKDYLAHNSSYNEADEKHPVSYHNVYSWVQKYKEHGPDGLVDGRGRGKLDIIQTEEERIRAENAALKARNEYLETENAALKKLEEVERELMSRRRGMRRNTKRSRNYKKKDSK